MQVTKIAGLSPGQFLHNFNEMTDDFNKAQTILHQVRKKNTSKLTQFKKFPIPNYYTSMQGLNIDPKQKPSIQKTNKNEFNKKDEEFRRNHNNTMKKIINKMIENNVHHMKILDKNKQFYKYQSSNITPKIQRTLSLNLLEKAKRITKQKEVESQVREYPSVNFKNLIADRDKKAYVIDFNPTKETTKRRYNSNMKLKQLNQINKVLLKRRSTNLILEELETQKTSNLGKESLVSISNDITMMRRNTIDLNTQSLKYTNNTKGSEKQLQQIDVLMNPERYIKNRFKNSLNINYEQDKKLRKMADNLSNEILYHYTKDFETKKQNDST